MQGPTSRPVSPSSPSPVDPPARDAASLAGSIQSPTAADTPLTSRLRGWDRTGSSSAFSSSQVPRASVDQATPCGPRRLAVDGKAEVRDPRIVELADDAGLSDDEDTGVRMPPARVDGKSPGTSFADSDPAPDALWTAMSFLGAEAGLSQRDCAALMHDPGVRAGLLNTVNGGLAAAGYTAASKVPDRVMAAYATDAVRLLLLDLQADETPPSPPASPLPADDGAPGLDELQRRFDALAERVAQNSPAAPDATPKTLERKSDNKG